MKRNLEDKVFSIISGICLIILCIVTIYPFLHVLAISLNNASDSAIGGIYIWPRKLSLDSYYTVFNYANLTNAFLVSVLRTVIGTVLAVFCTSMLAYALTKKYLIGYKYIYGMFIFTMFIGAGLIPTFMLYKTIHIFNTFWVYLLPGLVGTFNMILFRTFFMQLPSSMEESAFIDGANEFQIFIKIILPLSTPILATIGLFISVGQWNGWQDTLYFTSNPNLETLQFLLMKIIRQAEASQMVDAARASLARKGIISITPESIKMTITIVATVPILCVYPFLQRYFVKGMMIGAVKG